MGGIWRKKIFAFLPGLGAQKDLPQMSHPGGGGADKNLIQILKKARII
jgi:hypothetical protein